MKFRNTYLRYYMEKAGDDGSQGGGSGDDKGDGSNNGDKDAEKAELLREVMKKKTRIQEQDTKLGDLSTKVEDLTQQLGKFANIDLDKYQELVDGQTKMAAEKAKVEEERLKSEGKFEELLATKGKEHQSIIEQMRSANESALSNNSTKFDDLNKVNVGLLAQIEELTVGSAFSDSKLIHDDLVSAFSPLRARKLFGDHFDTEGGKVIGYDKPRGSEDRAPLVDANGHSEAFDTALKRIIEADGDSDSMFRSKHKDGSGSETSNRDTALKGEQATGMDRILNLLNATKS